MKINKNANRFEIELMKLIDKNIKYAERRVLQYANEICSNKDINTAVKRIYSLLAQALKEKYFIQIMNDFSLMEGSEYNGKSLKKYYGLFMLSNAIDITFFANLSFELSLYKKHFINIITPEDYFNDFKISNIIKSYFAMVPVYTSIIKFKSTIEHKRKTTASSYKKSMLFPRLNNIQSKNNKCELRYAIVIMENSMPGSISEAGEILNIKYKILSDQLRKEDRIKQKSKSRVRQKNVYSLNDDIEYNSRVLAEFIKSDYSRFLKTQKQSNL